MSGLAAILSRDGRPVDRDVLVQMLQAAPYRGPDGMRVLRDGAIGLGHAKMAIALEERDELQPLASTQTGCVIAADVRLDNRFELLRRLPVLSASSPSDAELILRAYETWGVDAPARLLGDFAFVIWDPREQRMVCARDTSGQKKLFYRVDARTFATASEIQQLLQDPDVPIQPNQEYILRRLVPINMFRNEKDTAETYYEGIYAVPPGHTLVVTRAHVQVRRYWEFQPPAELQYRTEDEYAEHFLELFSDVVSARLRTAGPVGALLSGGVDSSSIVCTAQRLYSAGLVENRGFTAFSSVYGDLDCDEEVSIREMQTLYGFDARYLSSRDAGGRLQIDRPGFVESPNSGSRDVRDAVCGAATQAGVRVLLSGEMADNCVGGSRLVFDSLLRHRQLRDFWTQLATYRRVAEESMLRAVVFDVFGPLLPLPLQQRLNLADMRRHYRRNGHGWLPTWMPAAMRTELSLRQLEISFELERHRRFASPARHAEHNMLYPPEISRHPAPWPVEIWRPFADRRLHEFLLAIPPEQKFRPHPETDAFYAGSKRVVRHAMRGLVPESVRTRTSKTVFDAQFRHQVDLLWPAYEAAFGPSASPEVVAHGYVDQDAFWGRLVRLRGGDYGSDLTYVLHMVGFENWLQALRQPRPDLVTLRLAPGLPSRGAIYQEVLPGAS